MERSGVCNGVLVGWLSRRAKVSKWRVCVMCLCATKRESLLTGSVPCDWLAHIWPPTVTRAFWPGTAEHYPGSLQQQFVEQDPLAISLCRPCLGTKTSAASCVHAGAGQAQRDLTASSLLALGELCLAVCVLQLKAPGG